MRSGSKRIAVLFHAGDRHTELSGYIVDHLAQFWREDGHEVVYVFGTRHFVPADVALLHVNLSVVPEGYLQLAARYPLALNARVRDIRKSMTSTNLVANGDGWQGPVIVKSDLNFGGMPERLLAMSPLERRARIWRVLRRAARRGERGRFTSWKDYTVFNRLEDVPEGLRHRRDVVVERFLPELEDGLFHLRVYQFLGDRSSCTRLGSPYPLFKAGMSVTAEPVEPHPEVEAWRSRLGMDYGKLDYLVHDGRPVLIDVNKTTGASRHMGDEALRGMRRHLAEGLYSYFSRTAPTPATGSA